MQAGKLDRRIIIQIQSTTKDAIGQPVVSWSTFASAWAYVFYKKGIESIRANQDTSVVQASMRIRKIDGVTAGMRVSYDSKYFNIIAILPQGNDALDLVCEVIN